MLYQVRGEIVTFPTGLGTLIAKEGIWTGCSGPHGEAPAKHETETGSSDDAMPGGSNPIRARPGQRVNDTRSPTPSARQIS